MPRALVPSSEEGGRRSFSFWLPLSRRDVGRGGPGFAVKAGSTITLRASWPTCPQPAMQGCGAETYLYYDPGTQALSMQREAMTVSWFATGGSFVSDVTGRASDDDGTTTDDAWTAPTTAGAVLVWVVLRDDRGGVSWEQYRFDVM